MRFTARTKKRIAILLAGVMLAGAGGGGLIVVRKIRLEKALDTALEDGTAAYQARDYATAMRRLGFYVGRRKEPEAVRMLADARRHVPDINNKHIPAAITYARAATELDPESLPAHELLLEMYLQAGYITEAATTAEAVLRLQPDHRLALEARVVAMARLGKLPEAVAAARAVAEAHPEDAAARRMVAELMVRQEAPAQEIRDYLEQDERLAQENFSFALLRTEAATLTNDAEALLERATHAATLPITSVTDLNAFLRLLDLLAPARPEARDLIDTVLGSSFPESVQREVAVIVAERHWRAGRNDLALDAIVSAMDASGSMEKTADGVLGWFVLLRQNEDSPEILSRIASAKAELGRRPSSSAAAWLDVIEGIRLLESDELRAAGERFEAAASRQADAILPEFLLGQLDRRKGEHSRALARWDALLRQHPNWRVLRGATIELLLDLGEYAQAAERAQTALNWTMARSEAVLLCRSVMMLLETRPPASPLTRQLLTTLDTIVQQAESDPVIQACAARAYLAAERRADADRAIQRILAVEEGHNAALLTPLAIAYRQHDRAKGDRLLELTLTSVTPASVYAQAVSLVEQDRTSDARELIEQRIAATSGAERLGYQLAMARLLAYSQDPTAAAFLIELASEHPGNPDVQTVLLESDASWTSEANVGPAIQRLKEIVGSNGTSWRMFEARRLLTFTPSQPRAAEAIQLLAPLIRQNSPPPMAFAMVGEAYLLLDDRPRAIEQFGRAVDVDSSRPLHHPRLIELLQAAGRTDEAVRRLTAFASVEPLPVELRRRRAQLSLLLAVWDQARKDFTALAGSGTAEDRFGLAIAHLRLGEQQRAAEILDELVTRPQATPAMLVAAADLRAASGDVPGGRQLLESAPADLPDVLRQALVAAYLQRHGNIADAERVLLAAAAGTDGTSSPDAIAELARFYLESGRVEQAREQVARGLAQNPNHEILQRVDALARIQSGDDAPEAWEQLGRLITSWTDAPPGLRQLTRAMQQHAAAPGDTAAHIERLRRITAEHPTFFSGWQLLVQAHAEAGDLRSASSAAVAAMQNNPSDPRPAQLAVTMLIQQQRYDDALAAALQWRSRTPGPVLEPDLALAWLYQQLGRPQEGLRIIEPRRQTILASDDGEQITLYAGLLLEAGRLSEARAVLWPRAEQSRQWALTWVSLTSRIKPDEAAREWLTRIAPILASASTAGATTEPGQDEATLRAAAQLALGEAWFQITSRTKAAADADKALGALAEASQVPAFSFSAHAISAAACDAIGNREGTERHYRLALAERDDDPVTLNNFAYFLAQEKSKAPEAADLAGRAVKLAREASAAPPVLRAILDTHGVALLECERWSEAEAVFREALKIEANAPDLLIGLAEARFGQGDTTGAAATLETARTRIAANGPLVPTRAARMAALESKLGR